MSSKPVRVEKLGNGKARLHHRVTVESDVGGDSKVSIGQEVLTPSYQRVGSLKNLASSAALQAGRAENEASVGDDLADGYYVLRVSAAVSNGKVVETNAEDSFIAVKGGEITPLSGEEFMKQAAPNGSVTGTGWDPKARIQ